MLVQNQVLIIKLTYLYRPLKPYIRIRYRESALYVYNYAQIEYFELQKNYKTAKRCSFFANFRVFKILE